MFIKKDILCNFKLLIACVLVVLMIFSVFNLNTLHVREELVYSDSTMSAIVYADAGMENMNSAGSVNVVLNDSLIESLENDLNTTIMQSTNELIWEKEAQAKAEAEAKVKAEAEAKAKAEAEAKAQAAVNANYGVEPAALSNTQVEATETQGTQTFKKNGLTFTYDPNLVYVNMENIEQRFKVYAPNDTFEGAATTLAKMALGEAGGCSKTEIAGTMWCVLNRYDEGYANSIHKVTTAKGAFYGYKSGNKVRDDIFAIAKDVLARWVAEKEGNTNVGRVLPSGYNWFLGDGKHNNYRNNYKGRSNWNWTLATPYLE